MSCFFVGTEFCSGVFINLGSGSFVAQWEVEPPWCPAGANRKWKVPIRSGQGRGWAAYHIDELDESQAKGHLDLLGHVLHGSDQLVVASEQVSHQPLLVPRAHPCNTKSQAATKNIFSNSPRVPSISFRDTEGGFWQGNREHRRRIGFATIAHHLTRFYLVSWMPPMVPPSPPNVTPGEVLHAPMLHGQGQRPKTKTFTFRHCHPHQYYHHDYHVFDCHYQTHLRLNAVFDFRRQKGN